MKTERRLQMIGNLRFKIRYRKDLIKAQRAGIVDAEKRLANLRKQLDKLLTPAERLQRLFE